MPLIDRLNSLFDSAGATEPARAAGEPNAEAEDDAGLTLQPYSEKDVAEWDAYRRVVAGLPAGDGAEELQWCVGRVEEITDGLDMQVDMAIRPAVASFNAYGFRTSQSCGGHTRTENVGGVPSPWLDLEPMGTHEDEASFVRELDEVEERARGLLADYHQRTGTADLDRLIIERNASSVHIVGAHVSDLEEADDATQERFRDVYRGHFNAIAREMIQGLVPEADLSQEGRESSTSTPTRITR